MEYLNLDPQKDPTKPSKNSIVKQLLAEYEAEKKQSETSTKKHDQKSPSEFDLFSRAMNWVDDNGKLNLAKQKKTNKNLVTSEDLAESRTNMDKLLAKSDVLNPNFEKLHSIPTLDIKERKLRALKRKEREKTKGGKWFNLPATEVTDEVKKDLEVLQMRSVLDPKHFYKKNDLKVLPKYFQIGQVMDSPLDYYSNRLTKKERKKTLVDELLSDAAFNKYNKKKYAEIIAERQKTHYKAYRQAKKLKRKKK